MRYGKGVGYRVWGLQYQIIPFAISCIAILNVMLGTVQARKSEISTYATIGLSPFHILFLFLAENTVYALIGRLTGYMPFLRLAKLLDQLMPGSVIINFPSSLVVSALGASAFVILLSSAYPVRLASRLVTPSLRRTWEAPTKPWEDTWEVPLPFYANTD